MRFKIETNKKYGFQINFSISKYIGIIKIQNEEKTTSTIGIRNHIPNTPYKIIFLDYDSMLLDALIGEIRYLQKKYLLSNAYILESSQRKGSYHVIILDYIKPKEWFNLIEETNCDDNYKRLPIMADNRSWVLRIGKKGDSHMPTYLTTIKSIHNKRKKSLAHAKFLKLHYKIPINKDQTNWDKGTKVMLINYKTMSYITKKITK